MKLSKLHPSLLAYYLFIDNKGRATVTEVAKQFRMLPSNVIGGLKRLEKEGLIIIKKIGRNVVCSNL